MTLTVRNFLAALLVSTVLGYARSASACAACFGASDSDMAKGMNMGIFALLGVVVVVLGGIASFFIYLARRANSLPSPEQSLSELTKQIS